MSDVFVTRAELQTALGSGTTADTTRLDIACIAATRWVLFRCGTEQTDSDIDPASLSLSQVDTTPGRYMAALTAAVHFYNLPLTQFGIVSGGEWAIPLRSDIPAAEAFLLGQRESFGFA